MPTNRRDFVKMAAAMGLAAAGPMPRRPLGKTGLQVSLMGLGGAPIGNLPDQQAAVEVVRLCYDLGMNYFDCAASGAYGLSQARYGVALKGLRDKIVLATKTRHRSYTQAEVDLNQSLSYLKTDHLDLWQLHNLTNQEDIDLIFGPRGVMELVEKARKDGKIRFVGVTGHADPRVLNAIIAKYPFDSVLMPLSVTDGANRQRSFEKTTLPVAREKGMGIVAMKTLGAGTVLRKKVATVEEALSYVWSLPVSTAILGCDQPEQVKLDARAAQNARPLAASAMQRLRERTSSLDLAQLEPWKPAAAAPEYCAD